VLADALAAGKASVIAAAGGVVLDPGNRAALRHGGTVVWLDGDPRVLATRATTGDHRPLLDRDPVATLTSMAAERRPLYEEVADEVVDVTRLPPKDVVERVLAIVRQDDGG
jgi:shikimate kinase